MNWYPTIYTWYPSTPSVSLISQTGTILHVHPLDTQDLRITLVLVSKKYQYRYRNMSWYIKLLKYLSTTESKSKLWPTSVQPISITKTLLIVLTKNERDPPLFTGKLLIKFQNILRNTTQVIIWHSIKILFSVISSPITLERQKWKSSKMKGILLSSPVSC